MLRNDLLPEVTRYQHVTKLRLESSIPENVSPERDKERAALPIPATDPSEVLTPGEFLKRTDLLYNNSLAANCRFFVTVFDSTGPTEKDRYKSLLRTVEGHFYKRLSLDRAPL